ncbi:UvrB/UvrC motif-containing protein [Singulisphaera rosea]
MSKDITAILDGWEHDPDELQVRIVAGADGQDKIQMRVDLGLLQMELAGRPDGQRPSGFESLLEFFEAKVRDEEGFSLDSESCAVLMHEGLQYYRRYLAAFHLHRFDLVARDTERNLRLFAFVVRHAARRRDRLQFDQYRPYVTMMHTRALALQSLEREDHRTALAEIDRGIEAIRAFLVDYDRADQEAECMELGFLLRWQREVESSRPQGPVDRLEQQLKLAVALEDYEEAARIRDQLQRFRGPEIPSESKPMP